MVTEFDFDNLIVGVLCWPSFGVKLWQILTLRLHMTSAMLPQFRGGIVTEFDFENLTAEVLCCPGFGVKWWQNLTLRLHVTSVMLPQFWGGVVTEFDFDNLIVEGLCWPSFGVKLWQILTLRLHTTSNMLPQFWGGIVTEFDFENLIAGVLCCPSFGVKWWQNLTLVQNMKGTWQARSLSAGQWANGNRLDFRLTGRQIDSWPARSLSCYNIFGILESYPFTLHISHRWFLKFSLKFPSTHCDHTLSVWCYFSTLNGNGANKVYHFTGRKDKNSFQSFLYNA